MGKREKQRLRRVFVASGGALLLTAAGALAFQAWEWAFAAQVAGLIGLTIGLSTRHYARAAPSLSHESQERLLRLQPNAEDSEWLAASPEVTSDEKHQKGGYL